MDELTNTAGITDSVAADLNGERLGATDEEIARLAGESMEDVFPDDITGPVKGPDEAHWGDEARAERGAELPVIEPVVGDDGEPPKGPAEEQWGDEARAERGAEDSDEVAEVAPPDEG